MESQLSNLAMELHVMIFVGLGFRKAVTTKSFENLFRQVFNLTELPGPIKALATLDTKALNPALQEFAAAKKVTLIPVSLENLQRQITPTQSPAAQAAYGLGSIAEAAALAAAGDGSSLIFKRLVSNDKMATCAFAKGSFK
jgi:cobalt-precorrin 5A hydrolase